MNIRGGRGFVRVALVAVGSVVFLVGLAPPMFGQGAVRVIPEAPGSPGSPRPGPGPAPMAPRDAIEDVVARYQLAFNALDAAAAKAIWPSVDERSLARAFRQLESQELTFAECQTVIASSGSQGKVTCRGSVRFTPRIGDRIERVELRRWEFALWRLGGQWRVGSVNSSADPQPR